MTRAYVAGIAPRSQNYMRRHWDHAKAFVDDAGLAAARREEETRWQAAQHEAGLDLVSPSYVATEDILRPLAHLPGASVGPLTRTFETNTFHRQPVITGDLPEGGLRPWVDSVRVEGPWVLSLPSPYDALQRCDVQDGHALVACLADAAGYALDTGAALVRFQEPTAAYHGHTPDAATFADVLATATAGHEDDCVVHFSQGDVLARPELLEAVPCAIGLEPGDPAGVDLSGTRLHAAVVRGERTLLERKAVGAAALAFAQATGAQLWAITNGWDLEHVPYDIAVRKLHALAEARPVEVPA